MSTVRSAKACQPMSVAEFLCHSLKSHKTLQRQLNLCGNAIKETTMAPPKRIRTIAKPENNSKSVADDLFKRFAPTKQPPKVAAPKAAKMTRNIPTNAVKIKISLRYMNY